MSNRNAWLLWIVLAAVAIISAKAYFGVNRLIEDADRQGRIMRAMQ